MYPGGMESDRRRLRPPLAARLGFVCFIAAALGLAGCANEQPNVVWIVVDALSAGEVGLYGGSLDATPFLDELGDEAIVFDRAYSQASSTLYSAASYLTARYPDDALSGERLRAVPDLAGLLGEAGYETAAFSENTWIAPVTGFARSFDLFELIGTPQGRPLGHRDSMRTVESALDWFLSGATHPKFLYLHLIPPHAPYVPPPPFRGRLAAKRPGRGSRIARLLRDARPGVPGSQAMVAALVQGELSLSEEELDYVHRRYAENVSFADRLIQIAVERIRDAGLSDSTLIVVSSDHGEAFGPHPELFHGATLYDTQIRVPLILVAPDALGIEPGRRNGPVELVDVLPTILDLLGVDSNAGFAGESLAPWLRGEAGPPTLARSFLPDAQAVISPEWKLIRRGHGDVLFDLERDPDELEDRSVSDSEIASRLAGHLVERVADASPTRVPLSADRAAELEALGYAVGPPDEDVSGRAAPREQRSPGVAHGEPSKTNHDQEKESP